MQNIEIKAPVRELPSLLAGLKTLGAKKVWARRQRDTFFNTRGGYLKLREVDDKPGELIGYQRAPGTEPRPSDYDIAGIENTAALTLALTRTLGVRGIVEKTRTLFLWQHTRIHLDEVRDLGLFMELETVAREISLAEAQTEAETVIRLLNLDPATFLDRPYLEMLESASG